jgi:hypothetical protein
MTRLNGVKMNEEGRMRVRLSSAFIAVLLATPVGLSAAQPTARANPYLNLFSAQLSTAQPPMLPARPAFPVTPPSTPELLARPRALSAAQGPAVVCGMTVVEGDPKIDARIFVAAPRRDVKPMMRIVSPTVCRR